MHSTECWTQMRKPSFLNLWSFLSSSVGGGRAGCQARDEVGKFIWAAKWSALAPERSSTP